MEHDLIIKNGNIVDGTGSDGIHWRHCNQRWGNN